MRRHGFTLIETLLAVGLLVAIVALVGPALFERLAPMTFDRVLDQARSALRQAREDARLEGRPLYVYAETDERGGAAFVAYAEPLADAVVDDAASPIGGAGVPQAAQREPTPADLRGIGGVGRAEGSETPGRVLLDFPDRVTVRATPPDEAFDAPGIGAGPAWARTPEAIDPEGVFGDSRELGDGDDGLGAFGGAGGPLAEPSARLVVVCLPDGTVLCPGPRWVCDAEGRAAVLSVDESVGTIAFRVRTPPREDGAAPGLIDDLAPPPGSGSAMGPGPSRGSRGGSRDGGSDAAPVGRRP